MSDQDLAILIEMGFAADNAAQALKFAHGNREEAMDLLLIPFRTHLFGETAVADEVDHAQNDNDGNKDIVNKPKKTTPPPIHARERAQAHTLASRSLSHATVKYGIEESGSTGHGRDVAFARSKAPQRDARIIHREPHRDNAKAGRRRAVQREYTGKNTSSSTFSSSPGHPALATDEKHPAGDTNKDIERIRQDLGAQRNHHHRHPDRLIAVGVMVDSDIHDHEEQTHERIFKEQPSASDIQQDIERLPQEMGYPRSDRSDWSHCA